MLLWDGFGLQSTYTGIGRYALELAEGLELLGQRPTILPSVPALDPAFERWQASLPAFTWGRIKPLSLLAAQNQATTLTRGTAGPHIFHGLSNYNLPNLPQNFRKVLTVHDLIPFLTKDAVSRSLRLYLRYQLPRAIAAADRIVCVSHWTAEQVKALYPEAKDRVSVIYNGRPALFERRQGGANRKMRLFSLCRSENYKRLSLIPEILASLPEAYEWHVLTDAKGVELLKEHPRLIVHTRLPEREVRAIWNHTQIFVHPSLWEGYCLPASTALSYCIPTVFQGGSGIDEVIGKAGIRMAKGDSPAQWAVAIDELSLNSRVWQQRCREQWLTLPSWQDVARQFQNLYDTLV